MPLVPLPHADVALDADFFCELVHWEHGRCGRSCKSQDHHMKKRSEGGSDDPSNRCLVCQLHHDAAHLTTRRKIGDSDADLSTVGWMFRIVLPDGDYAYAEELSARGERELSKDAIREASAEFDRVLDELGLRHGFREWELILGPFLRERGFDLWMIWSNVSERWEESAAAAHEEVGRAVELESDLAWVQACGIFELYVGQKWTLLGLEIKHDPRDPFGALAQYAPHVGLSYQVAKDRLRTERLRRRLPPTEAVQARRLPFRLMRDGGRRIVELSSEEREEVFALAEAGTAASGLARLDDLAGSGYKGSVVEVIGEVRLRVRAEVRVGEEGFTDDEQTPLQHVLKRLAQHKYVEEVAGSELREAERKEVASGDDQHKELAQVPALHEGAAGPEAAVG